MGVGLPLVRLGWRLPGLSVPLPPFSFSAPQNQKIFHDGVQQWYWAWPRGRPTCLRKQKVGKHTDIISVVILGHCHWLTAVVPAVIGLSSPPCPDGSPGQWQGLFLQLSNAPSCYQPVMYMSLCLFIYLFIWKPPANRLAYELCVRHCLWFMSCSMISLTGSLLTYCSSGITL